MLWTIVLAIVIGYLLLQGIALLVMRPALLWLVGLIGFAGVIGIAALAIGISYPILGLIVLGVVCFGWLWHEDEEKKRKQALDKKIADHNEKRKQELDTTQEPLETRDKLFNKAINLAISEEYGAVTVKVLQRHLKIGESRALLFMDNLEERGYIPPAANEHRQTSHT